MSELSTQLTLASLVTSFGVLERLHALRGPLYVHLFGFAASLAAATVIFFARIFIKNRYQVFLLWQIPATACACSIGLCIIFAEDQSRPSCTLNLGAFVCVRKLLVLCA